MKHSHPSLRLSAATGSVLVAAGLLLSLAACSPDPNSPRMLEARACMQAAIAVDTAQHQLNGGDRLALASLGDELRAHLPVREGVLLDALERAGDALPDEQEDTVVLPDHVGWANASLQGVSDACERLGHESLRRLEFPSDPDAQSLLTGQPGWGPETERPRPLSELLGG